MRQAQPTENQKNSCFIRTRVAPEGGIGIWQTTQEDAILSVNATLLRSKRPTSVRHELN
jgi:hypothetical protein